jgi:hypothetical protein
MLRVLGRYRAGETAYVPGQELHLSDALGEFLLRDSPGTFVRVDGDAVLEAVVTAAGFAAVDRRGRGGLRRDSAAQPEPITGEA